MRYDWNISSELGEVAMTCCRTLAYKAFHALGYALNQTEGYTSTALYCNGILVDRIWRGGKGPSEAEKTRLRAVYGEAWHEATRRRKRTTERKETGKEGKEVA